MGVGGREREREKERERERGAGEEMSTIMSGGWTTRAIRFFFHTTIFIPPSDPTLIMSRRINLFEASAQAEFQAYSFKKKKEEVLNRQLLFQCFVHLLLILVLNYFCKLHNSDTSGKISHP